MKNNVGNATEYNVELHSVTVKYLVVLYCHKSNFILLMALDDQNESSSSLGIYEFVAVHLIVNEKYHSVLNNPQTLSDVANMAKKAKGRWTDFCCVFVSRFQGAPYRSTCLLQPTSSSLVNVTEWVSEPTEPGSCACLRHVNWKV